jgi:cytochrome c5
MNAARWMLGTPASGVVSVSLPPVYNAADFVCALSAIRCVFKSYFEQLPLESSTLAIRDETDPMKKILFAVSVLMLSFNTPAAQDPEAVYARSCAACHNGQLPIAPQKGDQAAWAPRVAKGMDTLVQSVTNGLGAMPPGGLCSDCTAEDYRAVITLMTE